MLILSRKLNESIVIDGRIVVKVVRVDGDAVKLGIQAPADIPVHRREVYEEIQRANKEALTEERPPLPRLAKACDGAVDEARARMDLMKQPPASDGEIKENESQQRRNSKQEKQDSERKDAV
ncbi:MAG: carbon storage regulator CsrA [Verrucomicrobia bacterium]|nr:carbon storage regulator CsrA [Verrucomicrobiota bacterium]MCF7708207.1 carbon storage regulator CsrA [Verrucomicrobiota bacterium]